MRTDRQNHTQNQVTTLLSQIKTGETHTERTSLSVASPQSDDDDDLKQKVAHSGELLDRSATIQHLVSLARTMIESKLQPGTTNVVASARTQMLAMAEAARQNNASTKQLLEATKKDKDALAGESEATELKLAKSNDSLAERLAVLHERKKKLQEELDTVMGEILSTEQQHSEVMREQSMLGRLMRQKEQALDDTAHALLVQMQDHENEEDALEEAAGFFQFVGERVVLCDCGVLMNLWCV